MQLLARASLAQLKWRDVNAKTVTALKTGLFLKTFPQVSGRTERRSESFPRYTHQLTVCSPIDISLWRARQWEEYERHFARLVLGKKGQMYKTRDLHGMLGKETGLFYLLPSDLGIMHTEWLFWKVSSPGKSFSFECFRLSTHHLQKGRTASNNSMLYCICLLKNTCIATSASSPLETTFLIFNLSSKYCFCADWGLSSHLWYVPLTHTDMMILMIPWRHDHFFPAYNSGRVVKDRYCSTPRREQHTKKQTGGTSLHYKHLHVGLILTSLTMSCSFSILFLWVLSHEQKCPWISPTAVSLLAL